MAGEPSSLSAPLGELTGWYMVPGDARSAVSLRAPHSQDTGDECQTRVACPGCWFQPRNEYPTGSSLGTRLLLPRESNGTRQVCEMAAWPGAAGGVGEVRVSRRGGHLRPTPPRHSTVGGGPPGGGHSPGEMKSEGELCGGLTPGV